jgi:F420-dependent oxidoreductase-like protein
VRLSMPLPYDGNSQRSVQRVRDFEIAGLDLVWVAEAYGFDAVSLLGYLAARTETIGLGSGILPIYTRTPTLLAMTAAGLDELSGGRCVLGLGASGPQVIEGFHGVQYDRPVVRTREIVEICRAVWARDAPLHHDGDAYHVPLPPGVGTGLGKPLKIITHPRRPRIPIYVAALGERNVEMAAELADGWLPLFFLPERARDVFGPSLDEGRARRGTDLGPMEVCAGGIACIGEPDATRAVLDAYARPTAALYIGGMGARGRNFYNTLVRRYGYESEATEIQELYLAGKKDAAAAAVPDDLLELTNLCGTAGFVEERIAAFAEAGVTILNVTPLGPDPARLVERLRDWTGGVQSASG